MKLRLFTSWPSLGNVIIPILQVDKMELRKVNTCWRSCSSLMRSQLGGEAAGWHVATTAWSRLHARLLLSSQRALP